MARYKFIMYYTVLTQTLQNDDQYQADTDPKYRIKPSRVETDS